jgi:glycosyltransferase involved in cell wall biosynthesis
MLPKITIITPTLNQVNFIEQTIASVLTQEYPDLEYLVIDGGSTDGTIEILKKYEGSLIWTSERDNGQVDAINKGLHQARGEIVAYLNSDDIYSPGTLLLVGSYFLNNPTAQIVTGKCHNVDINGKSIRSVITFYKNLWLRLGATNFLKVINYISQPATFWRKSLHNSFGYFDLQYRFAMDYDFWLRIVSTTKLHLLNRYLASFRIYPTSITSSDSRKQFSEEYDIARKYSNNFYSTLHKIHGSISYFLYASFINNKKL